MMAYCPKCRIFIDQKEIKVGHNKDGTIFGVHERCGARLADKKEPKDENFKGLFSESTDNPCLPEPHSDNALSPFRFEDVTLIESVEIEGTPHFTRKAIGAALGYADPQNAIDVIVHRNPFIHEFSQSIPVKLTGMVKSYETQVFSPIGLYCITFKANTENAGRFQVWAAHLIEAYRTGRLFNQQNTQTEWTAPKSYDVDADHRVVFRLKILRKVHETPIGERHGTIRALARRHGYAERTIYRWASLHFKYGPAGLIDKRKGNKNAARENLVIGDSARVIQTLENLSERIARMERALPLTKGENS